jgi:hypothetical protein
LDSLTPNDSTSNFQQRPNNPIPDTTIIILWVLNNYWVDYWSVQSHKDLQRLQGHLIYWVLWLKFPVAFFTTIISSYTCSPSKRCKQKLNKARVGTLSLCGLYFPFGYIKPFFGDQKSKTLEKRVWKCVCVCACIEDEEIIDTLWLDMLNVSRGPNRGWQYGWRCSKLIMQLVEHKTGSTPRSKMTFTK